MTRRHIRLADERGFTIIEVMVASALLLGGMLGLLLMFNNAWDASFSAKTREQGVALQRELIETTRSIPFDKLTNNSAVGIIQGSAGAGLGDQGASAGWDIRRRNVTYKVAVGVCTVDDPGDGLGVHDGTFCATGAGATSAATCRTLLGRSGAIQGTSSAGGAAAGDCGIDKNLDGAVDNLTTSEVACTSDCGGTADAVPADYKRVVTLVRWDRGSGYRYALQSTTVSNPGTTGAPSVTDITATPDVVTSAATTSIAVSAVFSQVPTSATWYLDGTAQTSVTGIGATWNFTWALGTVGTTTPNAGEVLDGGYAISAKGFDVYGGYNGTKAKTVQIDRRRPYAPTQFEAGFNSGVGEIEWARNKERDIVSYRVYRRTGTSAWVQVCETTETACRDTTAPAGPPTFDYYAVAVDKIGEGDVTAIDPVKTTNAAPTTPSITSYSKTPTTVTLDWTASTDPDAGDSVDFYRIYRDGTLYADRYDRTNTGASTTYVDPNTSGLQHTYRVVAVDTGLQESGFSNAVTP